jgi:sphingolipid delta-4 desaturase
MDKINDDRGSRSGSALAFEPALPLPSVMAAPEFFVSAVDQPHPERSIAISSTRPEVRRLMGRNPWTALIALGVVSLQVALAASMGHLGLSYWWVALLLAYCVGAFANHCLYVVIHDATHRLIFRSRPANMLVAILADLPNVMPGAIGFSIYHLKHHAHQGDYGRDADIASHWEARLIGRRWYRKAIWLLLLPLFQLTRPVRIKGIKVVNRWSLVNVVAAVAFDGAIIAAFGGNAFLYLVASWLFSIGFHPLAGRWIQEHFTLDPAQETASYYGSLNRLALNVGYHNEHHDFPAVPWNRLPRVRALAPEFYSELKSPGSWTLLWLAFLFDPRYSLYSRVLRPAHGK